jgi:hypothetical protein
VSGLRFGHKLKFQRWRSIPPREMIFLAQSHCVTPTRFGPALLDSAVEWALNFVGRIGLA